VERMEERLEAAHMDQKRLFLIVFQRFIMILSEHLVRCDTDARDPDTHWYRSTVGRLRQVFLAVSARIPYSSTTPATSRVILSYILMYMIMVIWPYDYERKIRYSEYVYNSISRYMSLKPN
jgi:hypothetical protein